MHIVVCVVGFRNPDDIVGCLSALEQSTYADFEVLAQRLGLVITDSFGLEQGREVRFLPNLLASTAVFKLVQG